MGWLGFIVELVIVFGVWKLIKLVADSIKNGCYSLPQITCNIMYLVIMVIYALAVITFVFTKLNNKYWIGE